MRIFGLTGGIASGKTTIAKMLRQQKIPVFEADRQIYLLKKQHLFFQRYLIEKGLAKDLNHLPNTAQLRELILKKPEILRGLENMLHPLIHLEEKKFISRARRQRRPIIFLDIPLLFEVKDYKGFFDAVLLVYVCRFIQQQRAFKRKNMTAAWFNFIHHTQLPVEYKKKRSQALVNTGLSLRHSRDRLFNVLKRLKNKPKRKIKHP